MIHLYIPVNPEKDNMNSYTYYKCGKYDENKECYIACCRHFNTKKQLCNIFSSHYGFYCQKFIKYENEIAVLHFLLNEFPIEKNDQIIEISLKQPTETLCKNCLYWNESKKDLGDHKHFDTIYTCEIFNKGLNYSKTNKCPKRCNTCKQMEIKKD